MKAAIDVSTGQVLAMTEADHVSGNLTIFGHVDRLHGWDGSGWNPRVEEVEKYLASASDADLVNRLPSIEGSYLAIWRDGIHVYVFCDRYSQYRAYYRLSGNTLELFGRILGEVSPLVMSQTTALAFMLLRYVPGRQTLFDGIFRIMPGDCLVVDTAVGGMQIETACVYPKVDVEASTDEEEAIDGIHSLFREALEMRLRAYREDEPLLLPLSGGLDSRCLLGTALELVSSDRIIATTFGEPGSYDFEIGRKVALVAGVRHLAYPLSPADYSEEALEANCRDTDGQINFITEAPMRVFQDLAQYGRIVLSGLVGDAILGSHTSKKPPNDRTKIVLSDSLVDARDPLTKYLTGKIVLNSFYYSNDRSSASLSPDELWLFVNHFTKYSRYCVLKHRDAFAYITPFEDYGLVDYVLNLQICRRVGRSAQVAWLRRRFPKLASLPSKRYRGVSLDATASQRWLGLQWDRVQSHLMGINHQVNKIDFFKHRKEILAPEKLRRQMAGVLPKEFEDRIFGSDRYYLLLYNLKCLELLAGHFGVKFAQESTSIK